MDRDGALVTDELVSDGNGLINSGILIPGDYQFIETKAPYGYELDSTPIDFKVSEGQETAISLSMTNKLSPGDVILTKTDKDTGAFLEGAIFELQDASGNTIQKDLKTDKTGKITVTDLSPGDYQFVETQAPSVYELDSTPVKFSIEKGQTEATQVSMTNKFLRNEHNNKDNESMNRSSLPETGENNSTLTLVLMGLLLFVVLSIVIYEVKIKNY